MKKLLFLLTAALVATSMLAAPVDQSTALRKAKSYLTNELYAGKVMAPAALNPVLLKTEMSDVKQNQAVYYIYNTSTTYLVIAGDDRAEEILMVGDRPLKDINNLPPAMQEILNMYKEEISYLLDHQDLKVTRLSDEVKTLNAVTYGPLLTALWDQEAPYNNLCKFTYNNRTYTCLTGCPATSAAMVLYYWKYPAGVGAMSSYSSTLDIGSYYSNEVSYTYPALEATTFDWNSMTDTYSNSSSSASKSAVATLMRYVGQAEKMMYGVTGSGIYTTNSSDIATMFKNFGYDSNTRLANKSSYSATNWANLIIAEMAAGRPVVYLGVDNSAGGHAFNVDGYRDSDSKYHVNFGWSGDGNSWYAMNSFTYSGYTFSSSQQAIVGIQPPSGATPTLTVNPTSLTFTANTGETVTKTFTVTGTDLRGAVTISASGSYYNVSPTTLTADQAAAGATVTVTYKPTAAGTHTGTITVASTGAESKTVSLNGTATSTPTLNVDPTSLSFSTTVGTPVTQTFTLTGVNLTGVVYLSCSGTGFSIDKSNVTKTAATNGVTVTVTYNPTAGGTHTGTVTLTSSGAESKTVSLSGTAVGTPTITVSPASLNFNTTVGTPVTKTFTVTGTDLTGAVTLSCSGTGFSIDKTNITMAAATSGATVTVTYNPTAGGTHTGTVTITSSGATNKTVALNGTSTTVPSMTVTPTALNFNALVGETKTATFTVNGSNLTGPLTLTLNNAGGIYSINPTSITAAQAAAGATVTVTYAPTTFGTTNASVTISGGGVTAATITLAGQADLVKYAPVMLPANEEYINLTQFRADWTDATPEANVESYTLEVSAKPVAPVVELLSSIAGTDFTNSGTYYDITLPEPWGGNNLRGANNQAIYFRQKGYQNATLVGQITYTIPAGYENATFTMKITSDNTSDGTGNITVESSQTAAVGHNFSSGETYSWVVTASAGEQIVITSTKTSYSPDMALLEVYAGDATAATLMATEQGDANYRLITGITDKFYTVENLTAEGTFLYKVKALYKDGTESDWSNIEEVTLFQNGHGFDLGDVNHDEIVDITDVTLLINAVLTGDNSEICTICADMDANGIIDIADVTLLINFVLTGGV